MHHVRIERAKPVSTTYMQETHHQQMETKKPNIHCYRPTNLSVQAIPHLRRPLAICTLGGKGKGQGRSSEKWSLNDPLGNLIEFTTISIFAYCLQGSSLSVSGNLVTPSVSYLPLM